MQPIVLSIPFFVIGIILVLQYHALLVSKYMGKSNVSEHCKHNLSMVRMVGRSILILNIYYNVSLHSNFPGPFVLSVLVTFFESIMYWGVYHWFDNQRDDSEKEADPEARIITTRYADLSQPFLHVLLLFVAQSG